MDPLECSNHTINSLIITVLMEQITGQVIITTRQPDVGVYVIVLHAMSVCGVFGAECCFYCSFYVNCALGFQVVSANPSEILTICVS
jgi:hypothetical protein